MHVYCELNNSLYCSFYRPFSSRSPARSNPPNLQADHHRRKPFDVRCWSTAAEPECSPQLRVTSELNSENSLKPTSPNLGRKWGRPSSKMQQPDWSTIRHWFINGVLFNVKYLWMMLFKPFVDAQGSVAVSAEGHEHQRPSRPPIFLSGNSGEGSEWRYY